MIKEAKLESGADKGRTSWAMIDGNEACADVAYRLNELCSIYPITPATPMAELCDQWSGEGRKNIWETVPQVIEMQSELGASGTMHGALQAGSLTTSFTSSQGLLLMIPNMYKIAGELLPCVIHVASRAVSTNGLTIFCDHGDVMSIRQTGFAMLSSSSVQEAHDFAVIAQAASLESRLPYLHFFDGFRTSHEVNKIRQVSDDVLRGMIDEDLVLAHRRRAMSPDRPDIRSTVQNADVYFQTRESVNPFFNAGPLILQQVMDRFGALTGRTYKAFDYSGHPEAERVVILMGSGAETAKMTCEALAHEGEKVGVVQVHLFRPFSIEMLLSSIPKSVKAVAVLDRCKEPGSSAEPLYLDVCAAFSQKRRDWPDVKVVGGRFGIGGKEFHPGMVKGVLDELKKSDPKNHFTIGIKDDLTETSLDFDPFYEVEPERVHKAIFFGLGADGTVGANKNTIKIIGEDPAMHAQAYFLYDSKKSGSQTVSHLRFGPEPIRSTYLIRQADFVACHSFGFIERVDILSWAKPGATMLLNSPHGPDRTWDRLPRKVQGELIAKQIKLYVIDATKTARETGLAGRTNTVLQTCFFAISGVLPREKAISEIKESIRHTYGKKGVDVIHKNFAAVDATLENLHLVELPAAPSSRLEMIPVIGRGAPGLISSALEPIIAGRGNDLPVSALPVDGIFPSQSSKWEKRNVADFLPIWKSDICIQCGNCSFVCPHGCIRSRLFDRKHLEKAPEGLQFNEIDAKGFPDTLYTLQIYLEDCTGCGLCVEACPVKSKEKAGVRALNMEPKSGQEVANRPSLEFFETLPVNERSYVDFGTVRGVQFLETLFEFSGACTGCGEAPYVKLVSQLFGDRLMVANASGCSSVYGGALPTTPWSINHEGRGPAWATSLFEDNAEYGLGMRLAADQQMELAKRLLTEMKKAVGIEFVEDLLYAPQKYESDIRRQRERVARLKGVLADLIHRSGAPDVLKVKAERLLSVCEGLVRRSVWIIGGDGWAYDIGSSGVDHVLASGRDVNLLVLDNEVYANTGGQASKATPLGAVAKFANTGKRQAKKDLALQAVSYGNVYVARIAMGANPQQTLTAMREAEAFPGTSLVIAYSHCIAHGIPMHKGLEQQFKAVHSGYWPLMRYDPELNAAGENPFLLDSARPTDELEDYADNELRYRMLKNTNPKEAEAMFHAAEEHVKRHWELYEKMALQPEIEETECN